MAPNPSLNADVPRAGFGRAAGRRLACIVRRHGSASAQVAVSKCRSLGRCMASCRCSPERGGLDGNAPSRTAWSGLDYFEYRACSTATFHAGIAISTLVRLSGSPIFLKCRPERMLLQGYVAPEASRHNDVRLHATRRVNCCLVLSAPKQPKFSVVLSHCGVLRVRVRPGA